ncbi:hypothetical protein [Desulfosporosinus sp. OT]|uniref:hypothetical protein n=1 Tax=Desulfosporosinus sp. OT TaxID=913865 RepID=UPI001300C0BE|nr:hypothetical protein [Desulfosporosinus sp. OT]
MLGRPILTRFSDTIAEDKLKDAVKMVILLHKSRRIYFPAAKLKHHSYLCGFLQYITTMLIAAEKLTMIYPCNTDLLYFRIILHDI